MSSIDKNCYLVLKKWSNGSKTAFCPHLVIWWPSLLTLKFSKMLNTVPVSLSIDKSCHLEHWVEFSDPYLVIWWTWPLTFGPQISRSAQHCPIKSFWLTKNPTDALKWSYSSKTEHLQIIPRSSPDACICPTGARPVPHWEKGRSFSHISEELPFDLWNPKSNQIIFIP